MKFAIKDIKPNPFRHLDRYPINDEKVETLRESIRTTEFWDNIVARKVNGSVEIAYGHHRLKALRLEYDEDHEVNLIIRELDDGTMLQIMARENMDEWGNNVLVEQETVRAAVEAFAEGKIEFDKTTGRKDKIRLAPGYVIRNEQDLTQDVGSSQDLKEYTSVTVGHFLGWNQIHKRKDRQALRPSRRLERSLAALELIEREVLSEKDFVGLGGEAAWQMIRQTEAAIDRHGDTKKGKKVAKKVANAIAEKINADEAGPKQAGDIARKVDPKAKEIPDIGAFASKLGIKLEKVIHDDSLKDSLQQVCENLEFLDDDTKFELATTLDALADRARIFANQLGVIEPRQIGVSQ